MLKYREINLFTINLTIMSVSETRKLPLVIWEVNGKLSTTWRKRLRSTFRQYPCVCLECMPELSRFEPTCSVIYNYIANFRWSYNEHINNTMSCLYLLNSFKIQSHFFCRPRQRRLHSDSSVRGYAPPQCSHQYSTYAASHCCRKPLSCEATE
jgi:hypothetical protein